MFKAVTSACGAFIMLAMCASVAKQCVPCVFGSNCTNCEAILDKVQKSFSDIGKPNLPDKPTKVSNSCFHKGFQREDGKTFFDEQVCAIYKCDNTESIAIHTCNRMPTDPDLLTKYTTSFELCCPHGNPRLQSRRKGVKAPDASFSSPPEAAYAAAPVFTVDSLADAGPVSRTSLTDVESEENFIKELKADSSADGAKRSKSKKPND